MLDAATFKTQLDLDSELNLGRIFERSKIGYELNPKVALDRVGESDLNEQNPNLLWNGPVFLDLWMGTLRWDRTKDRMKVMWLWVQRS